MNDNVLIALITGACTALPAIIAILVNNKRFDDINNRIGDTNRRIDDNIAVTSAEIKAFRVEILGEIQALSLKIDSVMEQHLLEYHPK